MARNGVIKAFLTSTVNTLKGRPFNRGARLSISGYRRWPELRGIKEVLNTPCTGSMRASRLDPGRIWAEGLGGKRNLSGGRGVA